MRKACGWLIKKNKDLEVPVGPNSWDTRGREKKRNKN
jgi:hypothetical protein